MLANGKDTLTADFNFWSCYALNKRISFPHLGGMSHLTGSQVCPVTTLDTQETILKACKIWRRLRSYLRITGIVFDLIKWAATCRNQETGCAPGAAPCIMVRYKSNPLLLDFTVQFGIGNVLKWGTKGITQIEGVIASQEQERTLTFAVKKAAMSWVLEG